MRNSRTHYFPQSRSYQKLKQTYFVDTLRVWGSDKKNWTQTILNVQIHSWTYKMFSLGQKPSNKYGFIGVIPLEI